MQSLKTKAEHGKTKSRQAGNKLTLADMIVVVHHKKSTKKNYVTNILNIQIDNGSWFLGLKLAKPILSKR